MRSQKSLDREQMLMKAKLMRLGKHYKPQEHSTPERMKLLEIAIRDRAREKGREFYYIQSRCPVGHYSKRFTETGECLKCSQLKMKP